MSSDLSKEAILNYIAKSNRPVTKRDIANVFSVKGGGPRIALKRFLKELERDKEITPQGRGAYTTPEGLPSILLLEITAIDVDGDMLAAPVEERFKDKDIGRIEVIPDPKKGHPALIVGDRALCRISKGIDGTWEARIFKQLDTPESRVVGLVQRNRHGFVLSPADKREKHDYAIAPDDMNGAEDGLMAVGEVQPTRSGSTRFVRIIEVIGAADDPKAISLLSMHEMGLHEEFPKAVIAESEKLDGVPSLGKREDLRSIPLVTIDGADARDFDDAVYAEPLDDGGFHLIVAIADVAHYVRPKSPLDREAFKRGNSTYFPDRVVPMLPEALSNDLCSLRPKVERACVAVHMWIDKHGQLKKHTFVRGLMKSAARLTYEQVQAAQDGTTDDTTDTLMVPVITPLYAAYHVLNKARQQRGALDLDLPERRILIDENGNMTGVKPRERLDSHKLIEEFMVLANVAAAQALEAKNAPCIYRVHDTPKSDRVDNARSFVKSFGLTLAKGNVKSPKQLNGLLTAAAKLPASHVISTVILRTQAQAVYDPENIGHFGLALDHYAHFTSPIRRYADLIVHRGLIRAYGLGDGGLSEEEAARLHEIAEHISKTERVSAEAERNATDRFTAAYLSTRIGEEFSGRITGVTRFGLFIELSETGADGLVPIRTLPGNDFYIHDEQQHALIGRRSGVTFRLGAEVSVRVTEADGLTGSTLLELSGHKQGADLEGFEKSAQTKPSYNKGSRNKGHAPPGKKDRPFKKGKPSKATKPRRRK